MHVIIAKLAKLCGHDTYSSNLQHTHISTQPCWFDKPLYCQVNCKKKILYNFFFFLQYKFRLFTEKAVFKASVSSMRKISRFAHLLYCSFKKHSYQYIVLFGDIFLKYRDTYIYILVLRVIQTQFPDDISPGPKQVFRADTLLGI